MKNTCTNENNIITKIKTKCKFKIKKLKIKDQKQQSNNQSIIIIKKNEVKQLITSKNFKFKRNKNI